MKDRPGFTLIEMILVVVIIGLLAALVLPQFIGRTRQAEITNAEAQIESFKTALGQFEMDAGRFPTTAEGLEALVERPSGLRESVQWRRYLDESEVPRDPWGNEYVYRHPGTVNEASYDLFSPGPDGEPGTEDDIGNTDRTDG